MDIYRKKSFLKFIHVGDLHAVDWGDDSWALVTAIKVTTVKYGGLNWLFKPIYRFYQVKFVCQVTSVAVNKRSIIPISKTFYNNSL